MEILFETEDVLVVNKPEGLASIPERDPAQASLLAAISEARPGKLYVVHRIDKEASGVIVFAKNAAAHRWLNEQFRCREVEKAYMVLVHGVMREAGGTIERPLRQFGSGRMGVDFERGKPSVTEYWVLERFDAHSLVRACPHTGRRHQIRVHLYSIGHPVVGDRRYGDRAAARAFPRLMLHAHRIAFRLPSGEAVAVEAPVPESFSGVLERFCGGASRAD